jgi:hypothetical protein
VERRNGWRLAEAVGDRTPDGMQDFLSRTRWDADAVRDDPRIYVVEHPGDPEAVPVLDGTGFVKGGTHEVGRRAAAVQRHRGPHREPPDRGLSGLRQPLRPGSDRSRPLPAGGLGGGRRTLLIRKPLEPFRSVPSAHTAPAAAMERIIRKPY